MHAATIKDPSDPIPPVTPKPCTGRVIRWLLEEGRLKPSIAVLMEDFCAFMVGEGIPLARGLWQILLLHPQVRGVSFFWLRDRPGVREIQRAHGTESLPEYVNSPLGAIIEDGAEAMRYPLEALEPPYPYPVLDDLKAAGMTDYVALPIRFSTGRVNVVTWASDRPGGFDAASLSLLYDILPAMTTVIETHAFRRLAVNLLDTYVGRQTGARILAGEIRRGIGSTIDAVLFYTDLRGFTPLADKLPQDELIALLNNYFEIMGDAVESRGGEILKFIGDAMLAIFPLTAGRDATELCHHALDAAEEATRAVDRLNTERKTWGQPTIRVGIALHVGGVMYGNIGAPTRLDFTVIGPAVNLVNRLEGLCNRLNRRILASGAVARLCGPRLVSLGYQPVKGLVDPVEVFGLADE